MVKHVEREPTKQPTDQASQPTELTPEELERVSGGLVIKMTDVLITGQPTSSGGGTPEETK